MRVLNTIIATCLIAAAIVTPPAMAEDISEDLGRQILSVNDGWAAFGTNNLGQLGTTGGSSADAANEYIVHNRNELVAALGNSNATPKIIYVQGTIDANVDDNNQPLTCDDYAAGTGYSVEAYLAAYDPATWGRATRPSGPLETARQAAQRKQAARIQIKVGSNTTIVGLGDDARIVGANVLVDRVDNVIIRNLTFQDAADCFPQWDPTDGSGGNWNSAYDNISLTTATHVWIDHNVFDDGNNPDSNQPLYFGRPFQVHDGSLDITRGSDLVTASWNHFSNHDKTMLIGSTNNPGTPGSPTADFGKLRTTIHHNLFDNVLQRVPRVRFGQVHVFNNYYNISSAEGYGYSLGVGVGSQIYAQNNFFQTAAAVTPDQFIYDWRGADRTATLRVEGSFVNGVMPQHRVDLVAAYNAVNEPDLPSGKTWKPTLYTEIHPAQAVPGLVLHNAGIFSEE